MSANYANNAANQPTLGSTVPMPTAEDAFTPAVAAPEPVAGDHPAAIPSDALDSSSASQPDTATPAAQPGATAPAKKESGFKRFVGSFKKIFN